MGSRQKAAVGRRPPRPKGEYHQTRPKGESGATHATHASHQPRPDGASGPFGTTLVLRTSRPIHFDFYTYFYTLYKTLTICHHSAGGCPSLLAPSGHRGEAEYATQPGAKHQYGQDQPRPEGCGADCGASWPNYKSLPVGCDIISLPHI